MTFSREGADRRIDVELMDEELQQSSNITCRRFFRDSQAEGRRKRTTEERQGPEAAVKSHFFSKRRTVESIQIEPLISFFYTHPPADQGARLDPTEETDAIDWKRSAEQRYPLRRISKNCTPYRFSMLCLSLTNSPFRPSSSAVGGVDKQTHPFTDLQRVSQKSVCRSLRLNEVVV